MRGIFLAAALLFTAQAQALDFKPSPVVAEIFNKAQVKGTFVLYDVSANTFTGLDQKRAKTRYIPASTFKIPNSLIGLSTGAVSSVDEVLPYGGKPQFMKIFEQDMSLREAIKISNVPIYQELARRIGLEQMKANVSKLGYGTAEIGPFVDKFWLEGPLKISAVEQTQFLARLAQDQLPFTVVAQAQTREIARLGKGEGWTLYGKTGWTGSQKPSIGWWVGWLEQGGKVYSFALNIDMSDVNDGPIRLEVGKASLKALGLM